MNPRMPYYPPPPPPPTTSTDYHHNGYGPAYRWNEMRPDNSMNQPQNWDRNNRNAWKRNNNRNWQQKYNRETQAPYQIPKKGFNNVRFPRNSYFDGNNHQQNWPPQTHNNKTKPVKSPEDKDSEQAIPGIIANKKKRKPMSKSYPSNKWDEKDAEKALQAERDVVKNLNKQSLIIRFPDPDLSKEIVQKFHPQIESVHFPQSSTPRYCFAHLDENADIDKVVNTLEKIPFGQGFLSVDIKKAKEENINVQAKDIDPYTLYVGNLPLNVTKQAAIQYYPGCTRIDIGHPQQLKNTRYAFVRFSNVDDAIKAYKNTRNTQFESRSLIVRFRRINGNVGVPGENKQQTNVVPVPGVTPKTKTETQATSSNSACSSPAPSMNSKSGDAITDIMLDKQNIRNTLQQHQQQQQPQHQLQQMQHPHVPDLNLVKDEPLSDNEDSFDVKPDLMPPKTNGYDSTQIKREIKNEPLEHGFENGPFLANEDEVEHEEHEEYINDTYQFMEGPGQEDYEDEDDYDDEDDGGSDLDLNDSLLPYDDDGDLFNGDG